MTQFTLGIVGSIILGGLVWYLSTKYVSLWNRQYKITTFHHITAVFLALFTVVVANIWPLLNYMEPVTEAVIKVWNASLKNNQPWKNDMFLKVYELVDAEGVEDMSLAIRPVNGIGSVPVEKDETKELVSNFYSVKILDNFDESHPFLNLILANNREGAEEELTNDMLNFFRSGGMSYDPESAVQLVTEYLSNSLEETANRIVWIGRGILVGSFLLVSAILLSLIGWLAYRDIKVIG